MEKEADLLKSLTGEEIEAVESCCINKVFVKDELSTPMAMSRNKKFIRCINTVQDMSNKIK